MWISLPVGNQYCQTRVIAILDQERWFPRPLTSLPPSALQVEVVHCPGVVSPVVLALGKVLTGHGVQL